MGYGLSASNDSGEFLLSTDYQHYAFIGRFGVSQVQPSAGVWSGIPGYFGSSDHLWYCDVPAIHRPQILIELPVNTAGYNGVSQGGIALLSVSQLNATTWRVYLICTYRFTPPANCVFAFVLTSDIGASGEPFGLQLFDSTGALAFDSGRKPLILGGTSLTRKIWMTHAYSSDAGQWVYGMSTPLAAGSPKIGAYFTGNVCRMTSRTTRVWISGTWYDCEALAYQVFSYSGNTVYCNWAPIFSNCSIQSDGYSGIWQQNGSAAVQLVQGSTGADYYQSVTIVDPAFY